MLRLIRRLQRTRARRHMVVVRYAAGLPLAIMGTMHLTLEAASMRPILEAAHIPLIWFNALFVPVVEIATGLMLVAGWLARLAAGVGIVVMVVAIYAHLVADWPNEFPFVLPVVVLACASYVLWRGAGAWSLDARASPAPRRSSAAPEPKVVRLP